MIIGLNGCGPLPAAPHRRPSGGWPAFSAGAHASTAGWNVPLQTEIGEHAVSTMMSELITCTRLSFFMPRRFRFFGIPALNRPIIRRR
jgi:hypothetical protein